MERPFDRANLPFADRVRAGEELAGHLRHFAGRSDVIVLGLPRGGVPVAATVAVVEVRIRTPSSRSSDSR